MWILRPPLPSTDVEPNPCKKNSKNSMGLPIANARGQSCEKGGRKGKGCQELQKQRIYM